MLNPSQNIWSISSYSVSKIFDRGTRSSLQIHRSYSAEPFLLHNTPPWHVPKSGVNTCPQFRSKNVLFTLKLNLVMITLPNGPLTYCRLASRAGGKWKSLLCPRPFIFSSAQWESADSSSVFLPMRPSIRPKSKDHAGAHNRFIFPTLGYKSPHRHYSLLIGQSFPCLLLLPTQKP